MLWPGKEFWIVTTTQQRTCAPVLQQQQQQREGACWSNGVSRGFIAVPEKKNVFCDGPEKKMFFGKCVFDSDERTYGTGSLNANGVSSNTNSTIARIGLEKAGFTITWQTDVGDAWRCGLELERAHESTTTKTRVDWPWKL
jgi:hypothetical protein